jgi:predicted NBD/HSP70 family sugar kinase
VTDLYASPVHTFEQPITSTEPEAVAEAIAVCAENMTTEYGADTLVGLGLGIPALLDVSGETVIGSSHLGWRNVPLKTLLQSKCKLRIMLDNSVKLASLGEMWHGRAIGSKHFAYCSFGIGVGCSLIIGGDIVRGENGAAGELGHILVEPGGPQCKCGNIGCLEAVVGLPSIYSRLESVMGVSRKVMSEQWLADQASAGNMAVLDELNRVGKAIGLALSGAVNLLNPKMLICDGPLMKASDQLFPIIEEELAARTISFAGHKAELAMSALYPWSGAIGAAASVIGAWEHHADPLEPMTF